MAEAKVLVVGTGGIGCELLKNLVLTGFRDIVAVSFPNNTHHCQDFLHSEVLLHTCIIH